MKLPSTELKLKINKEPMPLSSSMKESEFANWVAFCNALKFINLTSKKRNVEIEEKDLDYRAIMNYVDSVSGDIITSIKSRHAIPLKYSLNTYEEESRNTDELTYEF